MRERRKIDPRLYLVTDPLLAGERKLDPIVQAAVQGGATLVQLRDKLAPARELLEQALVLKALLKPLGVPLLVNDRVDIAAAAELGCHVGQSDLPVAAARAILGPTAILGLSLDDPEQARWADLAPIDYVAYGPFAPTGTKADAGPAVGARGVRRVRSLSGLPLVAIGGIDPGNAATAIDAGADGVAVISAVMAAPNPETASRELRSIVDAALLRRLQDLQ